MKSPRRSRPVRTRLRFKVEVRSQRQFFTADARDVSVGGLCLFSPILLTIGDRAGASLQFADTPDLPLSFEVRWARPEGANYYLIGVEFVHTPESRRAMERLLWRIESGAVKGQE